MVIRRGIGHARGVGSLLLFLALAGIPLIVQRQPSGAATSPSTASVDLEAKALAVAGPGYRYRKTDSLISSTHGLPGGFTFMALLPKTREIWVAPDGSGRIRESVGEPVFLTERDRAAWQAAGSPNVFRGMNRDLGSGGLTYEDFNRYPTDPDVLHAMLREQAARTQVPVDDEMFVIVGDLARMPGVPPELSWALYQVAMRIPKVEITLEVTDGAGRRGVSVAKTHSYTGAKTRSALIFDPATGALLAEEKAWLEPPAAFTHLATPVVVGYATYLEASVVPEVPGEPLAPPPPAPTPFVSPESR